MSIEETVAELDETAWVYLAAHRQNEAGTGADLAFSQALADVCESFGFSVFRATGDAAQPSSHWLEALQNADLCVIDIGMASAVGGAELAMAYCSGRPLVALRIRDERPLAALNAILEHHPAAREIAFDDLFDCTEKLRQVFTDPAWQHLVRQAAVVEDL